MTKSGSEKITGAGNPREPRPKSTVGFDGFMLVMAAGVLNIVAGLSGLGTFRVLVYAQDLGAILSLIGAVICIAKRGKVRGIGFATAGLAIYAGALGMTCGVMLGWQAREAPLLALATIMIVMPLAFAGFVTAVVLFLYRVFKKTDGKSGEKVSGTFSADALRRGT
jgi:hypothetical protein